MLRSAASKVMWVGRATVFMVGLAVILGLLFGAASTALAHSGVDKKLFHLGHNNPVSAASTLAGNLAGKVLQVTNSGTANGSAAIQANNKSPVSPAVRAINSGGGPALGLSVGAGKAPMTVNSGVKVANLNSDRLDNLDSSGFYRSGSTVADSDKLDGNDSTAFVRRSGTLSIPGVTFQPRTSSTTTGTCWPESVTWAGSGENAFYAPVNLPSGVTVTKVIFHWWDNSSSSDATAELRRLNVPTTANPTTMATVSSNGSSGDHQSSQTTAITNATIDNTNAQYYVRVTFGSTALCVDGVQIEYAG